MVEGRPIHKACRNAKYGAPLTTSNHGVYCVLRALRRLKGWRLTGFAWAPGFFVIMQKKAWPFPAGRFAAGFLVSGWMLVRPKPMPAGRFATPCHVLEMRYWVSMRCDERELFGSPRDCACSFTRCCSALRWLAMGKLALRTAPPSMRSSSHHAFQSTAASLGPERESVCKVMGWAVRDATCRMCVGCGAGRTARTARSVRSARFTAHRFNQRASRCENARDKINLYI